VVLAPAGSSLRLRGPLRLCVKLRRDVACSRRCVKLGHDVAYWRRCV